MGKNIYSVKKGSKFITYDSGLGGNAFATKKEAMSLIKIVGGKIVKIKK